MKKDEANSETLNKNNVRHQFAKGIFGLSTNTKFVSHDTPAGA